MYQKNSNKKGFYFGILVFCRVLTFISLFFYYYPRKAYKHKLCTPKSTTNTTLERHWNTNVVPLSLSAKRINYPFPSFPHACPPVSFGATTKRRLLWCYGYAKFVACIDTCKQPFAPRQFASGFMPCFTIQDAVPMSCGAFHLESWPTAWIDGNTPITGAFQHQNLSRKPPNMLAGSISNDLNESRDSRAWIKSDEEREPMHRLRHK